jgi:hypothetical protein
MEQSMQKVLELADKYKLDIEMRAFAHYVSANYHRRRGEFWGASQRVSRVPLGFLPWRAQQVD